VTFISCFIVADVHQGALLLVPGKRAAAVKDAIVNFINNERRREACAIAALRHKLVRGEVEVNLESSMNAESRDPDDSSSV
jgi:hypothetical protein